MIDDIADLVLEYSEEDLAEIHECGVGDDIIAAIGLDTLDTPGALSAEEFESVTEAIIRSTGELDDAATIAEVEAYIQDFDGDPKRLTGLLSNVKGIHGELEVCERLNAMDDAGADEITYRLSPNTNEPDVDIYGYNDDGEVVRRIQVKVTENPAYIAETLEDLPPGVEVISGTEMAGEFPDQVGHVGLHASEIGQDARLAIERLGAAMPGFEEPLEKSDFLAWMKNPA
jgi:hypothetical protein